jgi:hypothetical protein
MFRQRGLMFRQLGLVFRQRGLMFRQRGLVFRQRGLKWVDERRLNAGQHPTPGRAHNRPDNVARDALKIGIVLQRRVRQIK